MDDQKVFEALSAIPPDKWFDNEELSDRGITADMTKDFLSQGLIRHRPEFLEIPGRGVNTRNTYQRSLAGNSWLRYYQGQERTEEHQKRMEKSSSRNGCMTLAILLLAIPAAVAAVPTLWEIAVWLLQLMQ